MEKTDVTVFDFSGIYESEDFYLQIKNPRFISCRDIPGTNCICDENAQHMLMERMNEAGCCAMGIHFIDSGNYHYMSELMIRQVTDSMTLVLMDHHPDMQPSAFGDILSCGSWVKNVLDHHGNVEQVIAIGVDEALSAQVSPEYRSKVHFYPAHACMDGEGNICMPEEPRFPIYLSVDKDVIGPDELITNWDQGTMRADEVCNMVSYLQEHYLLLGMDICGECAPDQEVCDLRKAVEASNAWNERILSILMK
ncbi:MAG: arginase family protein [Butyrivibrio sp.]|jgi:hypothetical protein|nr:arginase family protein [Butyrivibrio sp.]